MAQTGYRLWSNEVHEALSNMIIDIITYYFDTADPTLANKLRRGGHRLSDTVLIRASDLGNTKDFLADVRFQPDAGAVRIGLYENKEQFEEFVRIDKFRWAACTVDNILTPRAFDTEDALVQFAGQLAGELTQRKRVFENGYVNTQIGTHRSTAAAANRSITVTLPNGTPITADMIATLADLEAYNRLKGQTVSKAFKDEFTELQDNRRDKNELGYLRAYRDTDLILVVNAQAKSQITDVDLPTVFHKGEVFPMETIDLDQHYFGDIYAAAGTAIAGDCTMVEKQYGTKTNPRGETVPNILYPGEAIPVGQPYLAGEAYKPNPNALAKMFTISGTPFLTTVESGGAELNPGLGTTNHYLIWGYSTIKFARYMPFISFDFAPPVAP